MRFSLWCLLFLFFSFVSSGRSEGTGITVLSQSQEGHFQLRRLPADPGDRGEARKALEITDQYGKTLFQWNSPLGTSAASWSQDGRFLAVNDAPGRGGDQVWVFSLDPISRRVIPIREPDARKLRSEVESRHGGFFITLEKVTLRFIEWRDDRLWCHVTGSFASKRQRGIHVPFHYLWVFKCSAEGVPMLEEEWTRTDPRERPARDPE